MRPMLADLVKIVFLLVGMLGAGKAIQFIKFDILGRNAGDDFFSPHRILWVRVDSLLTRLQPTSYVTNSRGTQNRLNQQMAIFASGLRGAPEHCKNGNSNTMPSPAGPNALFRRRRADSAWHREADPAS